LFDTRFLVAHEKEISCLTKHLTGLAAQAGGQKKEGKNLIQIEFRLKVDFVKERQRSEAKDHSIQIKANIQNIYSATH
jgi:hypothetical protein